MFVPTTTSLDVSKIETRAHSRGSRVNASVFGLPRLKPDEDIDAVLQQMMTQLLDGGIQVDTAYAYRGDCDGEGMHLQMFITYSYINQRLGSVTAAITALLRLWVVRNPDHFVE